MSFWSRIREAARDRLEAGSLFKVALIGSLVAHGIGFAYKGAAQAGEERIVQIPVVLEAEEAPPPPVEETPPPPPKQRPRSLPSNVQKVVESDGVRSGDLVDAEAGDYAEEAPEQVESAPEPPPPPPPPPRPKEPEVDKVQLTREFLSTVRNALAASKRYPFAAQRLELAGSVTVAFVVQPCGTFSAIQVRRSSGHSTLDEAALQTVRSQSGRFKPPTELGGVPVRTSVVLRYSLDS